MIENNWMHQLNSLQFGIGSLYGGVLGGLFGYLIPPEEKERRVARTPFNQVIFVNKKNQEVSFTKRGLRRLRKRWNKRRRIERHRESARRRFNAQYEKNVEALLAKHKLSATPDLGTTPWLTPTTSPESNQP